MKTITFKEAVNILEQCSAVIIDHSYVLFPILDEGQGIMLRVYDENDDFEEVFYAEDNNFIHVNGDSLMLNDGSGDHLVAVTPLFRREL